MRYLYAIAALGLVITLHELGHLLAARLLGMRVERFTLGFGPTIIAFKRRGIAWVLSAIPLGGQVRIVGMNPHEKHAVALAPDAFSSRPWWHRELVLFAGSGFNLLTAIAVLAALFVTGTHVRVPMTVGTVEPGSVAARAALVPGDEIVAVNGTDVRDWSQLITVVHQSVDRPLTLKVRRANTAMEVSVVPRADESGVGRIGISQQYVWRQHGPGEALRLSFGYLGGLAEDAVNTLVRWARGPDGTTAGRPTQAVKQVSDAAAGGLDTFLRVLAQLSVVLAAFYLLPFPALDGGRMLFIAIEALRKRPIEPWLETLFHALGFVAMIAGIVLVAVAEVRPLRPRSGPVPPTLQQNETRDGGAAVRRTPDEGSLIAAAVSASARSGRPLDASTGRGRAR